jgi:hypothetical protein
MTTATPQSTSAIAESARTTGNRECLFAAWGEKVFRKDLGLDYTVPEMFSGSILDLEPNTEYEARFKCAIPTACVARRFTR